MKSFKILLSVSAIGLLGGCASPGLHTRAERQIQAGTRAAQMELHAALPKLSKEAIEASQEVDRPYLFGKTVPVSRNALLPKALQKDAVVGAKYPTTWVNLRTAAQRIMAATNIVVTITPDVYLPKEALEPRSMNANRPNGALPMPVATLLSGSGAPPAVPRIDSNYAANRPSIVSESGNTIAREETVHGFDFPAMEAPLSQILDLIATKVGIHWKYDERTNSINFYRMTTRNWETSFSSSKSSYSTKLGGTTSSSTNSANVQSQAIESPISSVEADLVELASIKEAIENTLLSKSGVVYANPATGTITVTDTEEVVNAADELIRRELKQLNRGVRLWFQTVQVTRKNALERGIDLNLAVSKALQNVPNFSVNTTSPATLTGTNAASLTATLFSGSAASSSAIIRSLNDVGNVHTSTSLPLITRNRRAIYYNVRKKFSYVSGTLPAAATTGGTGGTPGITTSQDEVGMKLMMRPVVSSKDMAAITLAYDQSNANPLTSFTSGGQTVQLTDTDGEGSVLQEVPVHNGQTMVLTGFDRSIAEANHRSLGERLPWFTGGSVVDKENHSITLVLVTVEIIDAE